MDGVNVMQLDCRAQDHEIRAHAMWSRERVNTLLSNIGQTKPRATPGLTDDGMKTLFWAPVQAMVTTPEQIESALDTLARECYAKPCAPGIKLAGRIGRMTDVAWWVRNLRRETVKRNEVQEHAAGAIRRKTQCYASDHAVKVKAVRAKANRATLERLEVVNEAGQAFNLQDVADKSVSNPKIRRGELMTRARGFEEAAQFMGHVAIFMTITCPSRFHRWTGAGKQNPAWVGDTPRDGQDYLCAVWARIRAAWGRRGFAPYGFRVAEPHHDGCPHWHILLFMPADHKPRAVDIVQRAALKDTPGERGAIKHRFTVEVIDTTRGSATGYISKYISKNIDGLTEAGGGIGLDFASGTAAVDSATRVKTWASTWSIRQFQQIGGPSVTVWRELRRLGAVDEHLFDNQMDLFDGPQNAADRGMWSLFWMLQGGPDVKRKELTLAPAYTSDEIGKYGEQVKKVAGVAGPCGEFRQTRLHTWAIQTAGQADADAGQAEHRAAMDAAAAVQRFLASVVRGSDGACAAWTGVNNCTGAAQEAHVLAWNIVRPKFNFDDFEQGGEGVPYLPEYNRRGCPETLAEEVAKLEFYFETRRFEPIEPERRSAYASIRG